MRKNSVAVALGNVVEVGDTLGLVGSSGYSYGPHIHFELHHNGVKDPFNGACQPDSSRWIEQADYVMDLPFELMDHGLTTLELSWPVVSERPPTKTHVSAPAVVYSWLRLRNTGRSDDLTWEFYENGSFWNSYTFSPDDTYSSSWWYTYWTLPESSDYQGSWSIKIYRNGEVMAQQDFTYDDNENRLPLAQSEALQLESGSSIEGEFTADDPDGSIFWYEIAAHPSNGTLTQSGGRKRKFRYTPDIGFAGLDTVTFFARDDENAAGEYGRVVFNVVSPLEISQSNGQLPERFKLYQNYPNPFNPTTTLRYDLPERSEVMLTIYGVLGREVTVAVDSWQEAGSHEAMWDGTNDVGQPVSAGIYLYQIRARGFSQVKKMVLLR